MTVTYECSDGDLLCLDCDLPLPLGVPVAERLSGVSDGTPVVELVCVYCATT